MMTTLSQSGRRGMMGFCSELVPDPVAAWRAAVAADTASPRSLYVHFPFCRSRCPFCPFYLGPGSVEERREYIPLLCRELADAAPELGRHPINAVYFGGGTPSDFSGPELTSVLETIHRHYRLAADCEITVEGRIDGFDPDKVELLAAHGVNRLSIGIQTFDTGLRLALGRQSEREFILKRLRQLSELNELSIVADLLYGLPGQTRAQWEADLDTLFTDTRISGVDLYWLRLGEHLPLARAVAEGRMPPIPDEDEAFALHCLGVERMRQEGAVRLSGVHFALDARERNLHNTLASTKHVCLPFGIKAGGRLAGHRFHQHSDYALWRTAVHSGVKPVREAGKLPEDFAVCGVLAGQIYRQMRIAPEEVMRAGPEALRNDVRNALETALPRWVARDFLTPPECGFWRLTERANFSHRALAADLMERIAGVFS